MHYSIRNGAVNTYSPEKKIFFNDLKKKQLSYFRHLIKKFCVAKMSAHTKIHKETKDLLWDYYLDYK